MQKDLKELIRIMREKKLTIAFAESVTSGLLTNEFAKQCNIGEIVLGGLVTYKEECKVQILGVKSETLKKFTAESQEVTTEMLHGLRMLIHSDFTVAVTGLATEGGSETEEKPVGSVFVSIFFHDKIYEYRDCFFGDRDMVIYQSIYMIVKKLLKIVENV